ncbi:hypothetical protein AGMMS49959_08890 [Planctomycetales bacterium]|nr:hypothetical protein AGMMS49959_08890 [Planctomycetales bacterium]
MIRDVPKPSLSPDFTLDDIHKIRRWHDEKLQGASRREIVDFYNRGGERFYQLIKAGGAGCR